MRGSIKKETEAQMILYAPFRRLMLHKRVEENCCSRAPFRDFPHRPFRGPIAFQLNFLSSENRPESCPATPAHPRDAKGFILLCCLTRSSHGTPPPPNPFDVGGCLRGIRDRIAAVVCRNQQHSARGATHRPRPLGKSRT